MNCILLLSGNMGKGVFIPILILVSIFFTGCDKSKESKGSESYMPCNYDTYKCDGDSSYYCGYSGDDLLWTLSETCRNGCDSSTGKCKSGNKIRVRNCTGLPENAEWNTVSSITQTWDGSAWEPPTTGSYNVTSSIKECRFKCKSFYNWENSKCVASTQQAKCSSKPAHSVWNDNGAEGKFTQTWNGFSWKPASFTSTHSTTACECCFKCIEDYLWGGAECVLDTCAKEPCINVDHATGECVIAEDSGYACKCAEGFMWNGNACIDLCVPNPCAGIENSTEVCVKEDDFTKYSCGCAEGFMWNGNACIDPCVPNPCRDKDHSTGICTVSESGSYACGCESGSVWNGSKCLCPTDQCSPTSGTPCTDSSSSLMWSAKAPDTMNWNNAVSYCDKLIEFGFNDWHLPNIDELRTLIKDRETATGGSCQVSEANNCLSSSSCWSWETCAEACNASFDDCISYNDGRYSKFGDTRCFWSSSIVSDDTNYAWMVCFRDGDVSKPIKGKDNDDVRVRCVR